MLELLLGYGLTRKDTKPLAKELLRRFGSIRGCIGCAAGRIIAGSGLRAGAHEPLAGAARIACRYAATAVRRRDILATPQAVAQMARARLAGCPHEECWVALVDKRNGLIAWERLQRGGIGEVPVQPRDVLEMALMHKAGGIILVHNHPGGSPAPSQPDILLTTELQRLAPRMGLRFLDHVVVTEGECYSITQSKLI